jgi:hypothetical protein
MERAVETSVTWVKEPRNCEASWPTDIVVYVSLNNSFSYSNTSLHHVADAVGKVAINTWRLVWFSGLSWAIIVSRFDGCDVALPWETVFAGVGPGSTLTVSGCL